MTEQKELEVPYADQAKTLAKLKKDGWTVLGIQFSPKTTHCLIRIEREKGKRKGSK